ncbi:MAG TPA: MGMT family protein [Nitrososphaera sp.]|nr:MGMT family protein [Nitrososphaera sp.]
MENSNTLSATAVYAALMKIPRGKVTTYGDIAKIIGRPTASRAVGRILNKNPNPVKVPCHRVVMSDGTIGGYAFGKSRKKELLESEGLCFAGDSVVEFNRSRLDAAGLV